MLKVKTKSGSVYSIDVKAKTWRRDSDAPSLVRTQEGKLIDAMIYLGQPMVLEVEPVPGTPEGIQRFITTTPVVDAWEEK